MSNWTASYISKWNGNETLIEEGDVCMSLNLNGFVINSCSLPDSEEDEYADEVKLRHLMYVVP